MSEQVQPLSKSQARRRRRQRAKAKKRQNNDAGSSHKEASPYEFGWCKPEDADRVRELLQPDDLGFDLDLSELEPYWLCARMEGRIVSIVQICYSKPFSRVECMCWEPTLGPEIRKDIIEKALPVVMGVLGQYGCQGYFSVVSSDQPDGFDRTLARYGYQLVDDAARVFSVRLR